jgi:hypothetical protein
VPIHLTCREARRLGSVLVKGELNVCPVLDSVLPSSPSLAVVGMPLAVAASAHDPDAQPGPLQYQWAATSGTFSDASAQAPSYSCAAAGQATLTISVGDGDAAPGCADVAMLTIDCVP